MNNFVCVNNAAISALMLLQRTAREQKAREQKNANKRDGRDRHDPSYLLFIGTNGDVDIDEIKETRIVSLRA